MEPGSDGAWNVVIGTICCGPFILIGLWLWFINSSVDRDHRKGRCSMCGGRGRTVVGGNKFVSTCPSCNGSGRWVG